MWDLNLPFRTGAVKYETGPLVADDAGRFYLTQHFTDVDGYASRSLIHVFSVR